MTEYEALQTLYNLVGKAKLTREQHRQGEQAALLLDKFFSDKTKDKESNQKEKNNQNKK